LHTKCHCTAVRSERCRRHRPSPKHRTAEHATNPHQQEAMPRNIRPSYSTSDFAETSLERHASFTCVPQRAHAVFTEYFKNHCHADVLCKYVAATGDGHVFRGCVMCTRRSGTVVGRANQLCRTSRWVLLCLVALLISTSLRPTLFSPRFRGMSASMAHLMILVGATFACL
jgi:hypothetical protein